MSNPSPQLPQGRTRSKYSPFPVMSADELKNALRKHDYSPLALAAELKQPTNRVYDALLRIAKVTPRQLRFLDEGRAWDVVPQRPRGSKAEPHDIDWSQSPIAKRYGLPPSLRANKP